MQQMILRSYNEYARSLRYHRKSNYHILCIQTYEVSTTPSSWIPTRTLYRHCYPRKIHRWYKTTSLPHICKTTELKNKNRALANLKKKRSSITNKPSDKNLGIVMNTDVEHLSDINTYRLASEYPSSRNRTKNHQHNHILQTPPWTTLQKWPGW